MAFLYKHGYTPDVIELLIIAVINSSSSNIHSFTSQVGIGSRSHDFVGLDSIRCLTSSRVRSRSVVSLSPLYLVSEGGLFDKPIVLPSLIVLIFSQKYSLNSLESILGSL